MRLAVFDFDSTLMDGETIEFLAELTGREDEVRLVTERAMRGELDFFESLKKRVALLRGADEREVVDLCHNLPLMRGAKEVIGTLKGRGYKVVVFSGGFRYATSYYRERLGYDADFSNTLYSKEGLLTGKVGGEMMFTFSKGMMIQKLQKVLGVSEENTLVVGDGANDKSMFAYAATRVAFCAKPILKEAANVIVDEKDLTLILNHLKD